MSDIPAPITPSVDTQRRRLLQATAAGIALGTLAPPAFATTDAASIVAATRAGRVRGLREQGVHAFKGIRYGADTTGARFQPPRAPRAWSGVADATAYAASAPQRGGAGPGSEDCLFLNVWTPALADGGKRPVLVYIHGGYDDIFPKIEEALQGKSVGETVKVKLQPDDAFGEYDAEMIQIESRVMARMAINHIIPAALDYKSKLLKEVALSKDVFGGTDECKEEIYLIKSISKYVDQIREKATAMVEARKKANVLEDEYAKAVAYHEIAESFPALRRPIDKLEEIVDNRTWPLPKYRELLFIS